MNTTKLNQTVKQSLFFLLSIVLERTAFYGIRALLIVYMSSSIFEIENIDALTIFGWFTASILLAKVIGALLGDFILGNKNSIIIGGILQSIGAFSLCIPSIFGLYTGLFLICLGGGLYSSNLKANFGKLHLKQVKLLDSKFTLLYLFINIGSFLGGITMGVLSDEYGFIVGFLAAGIIFLLSAISILKTKKEQNVIPDITPENLVNSTRQKVIYIALVFLLVSFFWLFYNIAMLGSYTSNIDWGMLQNSSSGILQKFLAQQDFIYIIPFSLILYFLWSKFYYNQLYKIAFAFIFGAISFSIILLIQNNFFQSNVSLYFLYLFFLHLAEAHIAPVIHSTLTQYTNPKYLATLISLSNLPVTLLAPLPLLVFSVGETGDLNNIVINTGIIAMVLISIGILTGLYLLKRKKGEIKSTL